MQLYFTELIRLHYNEVWENEPRILNWHKGPVDQISPDFSVLEYPPTQTQGLWTYATCGMAKDEINPVELHIFSSYEDTSIVELLTAITFYHQTTSRLDLNHTVNFGRPWQSDSECEYGLISLPYLDGPELETLQVDSLMNQIKFFWLIPITKSEVEYKIKFGVNALEEKFDSGLDYANPLRKSLV